MIIRVLGPGCRNCKTLYEIATKALKETGVEGVVEKVEDIQQIMSYQILMTPGLVINEQVKSAGRIPSLEEVKTMILASEAA
jgi:small redox-active disulfide protein 2